MNKLLKILVIALLPIIVLTSCGVEAGLYIAKDGTYYRTENGTNHTGFLETDEGTLYFGSDGKMVEEGMITVDGEHYAFLDGKMVTGWQNLDSLVGGTYYFDANGRAVRGEQTIGGKTYLFNNETGVFIRELEEQPSEVTVSPEPSEYPEPTETAEPIATPEPSSKSAAVGKLTGNAKLDDAVKKVIDQVTSPDYSDEKNLGELFDWMVEELKYKYVTVDLSNGYTEELVNELAEYVILNRRGACEHQAALMAVFIQRLGFESIVVKGDFLSDDGTEWVEHGWALGKIDGSYYHFDPLYGRNHTGGRPRTFFMKKDAEIEDLHRWDRDAYPAAE